MTNQSLRRVAEYSFMIVFLWGLYVCTSPGNMLFMVDRWDGHSVARVIELASKDAVRDLGRMWPQLLLLLIWCSTPIFLRPLTTRGVSTQQRYVVAGLNVSAGLVWWIWFSEPLESGGRLYLADGDGLPLLAMLGLLALAGYFRVGWQSDRGSETDSRPTKSSDGR
jgi:hypothetical protein